VKPAETKLLTNGKTAPIVDSDTPSFQSAEDRLNYIATAAYYSAEARGFKPGQEIDDWLEAEAKFT
jgi:hypothetical protein